MAISHDVQRKEMAILYRGKKEHDRSAVATFLFHSVKEEFLLKKFFANV